MACAEGEMGEKDQKLNVSRQTQQQQPRKHIFLSRFITVLGNLIALCVSAIFLRLSRVQISLWNFFEGRREIEFLAHDRIFRDSANGEKSLNIFSYSWGCFKVYCWLHSTSWKCKITEFRSGSFSSNNKLSSCAQASKNRKLHHLAFCLGIFATGFGCRWR